jgi:hypothetical protein
VDQEAVTVLYKRITSDTGFVCRALLGWDYDLDVETGQKIRPGGVRKDGNHGRMLKFVDDQEIRFGLLLAPRESYKSSVAQGRVVREIIKNPNTRVLYIMRLQEKVVDKALGIRNALLRPEVQAIMGSVVGPLWTQDRFTIAQRTQTNLQEPTFSGHSFESLPTGGHYDLIVLDDFIDHTNCQTEAGLKKQMEVFALLYPFLANGGTMLVLGTRYADQDVYNYIEQLPLFSKLIIDAGVDVVQDEKGKARLTVRKGGLTFPHLTMPKLEKALQFMMAHGGPEQFSRQYNNEPLSGLTSAFRRHAFQPINWTPAMKNLTGYMLTDTAVAMNADADHSVIAYIGVDQQDNIMLLDLRVGHFQHSDYVAEYFDVLEKWKGRVNHVGEVWEEVGLNVGFIASVRYESVRRGIKVKTITIPRAKTHKDARIKSMQPVMSDGRFFVVDTVPTSYRDVEGEKELWNPDGYLDPRSNCRLPSGELVNQFVRFGLAGTRKDIADALAMSVEHNRKTERRVCKFQSPMMWVPDRLTEILGQVGSRQHQDPAQDSRGSGSWWDTVR